MMNLKPSLILSAILWLSFITILWLMVLESVPADGKRIALLIITAVLAVCASALADRK
jgi:predicted membrane metal-binding protein